MARRSEHECAYCAEDLLFAPGIVGRDRKVYCSSACTRAGEQLSDRETHWLMRSVTGRHDPARPETPPPSLRTPVEQTA